MPSQSFVIPEMCSLVACEVGSLSDEMGSLSDDTNPPDPEEGVNISSTQPFVVDNYVCEKQPDFVTSDGSQESTLVCHALLY